MRHPLEPLHQRPPVPYPIRRHPHQAHMRRRSQQPVLQVPPHPVRDRQRQNQRSHTRRNPHHRDRRDHPDHRLPTLRPQIPRRYKELESHKAKVLSARGRQRPPQGCAEPLEDAAAPSLRSLSSRGSMACSARGDSPSAPRREPSSRPGGIYRTTAFTLAIFSNRSYTRTASTCSPPPATATESAYRSPSESDNPPTGSI